MQSTTQLGTGFQQEVHLEKLYMDVAAYNHMVTVPVQIPTIVDIACGSGGTACSLSSDGRTLTVTLGSVSTVQTGTAGLDYPATVTNVSTGWKDQGGTALDLAGSPDKVLDTDTTAPTITDVRATVDGGLTGDSGTGDTHRFIFSEVMATDLTSATYKVTGQNGLTDTVSCASPNSCAWNASPVTIGGVSYQAHRVLTVTINLGSNAASYSLTITAISGLTDVAGNDVTLTGSDKTIEVAA